MAQIITSFQQLDLVLMFLAKDRGHSSLEDIKKGLKRDSDAHYDGDDLLRILNKLAREGYVHYEDMSRGEGFMNQSISERRYAITFDGKLFILEKGGYEKQSADEKLYNQKIALENSQNRLNQKLLVYCAFGAAIGAIGLVVWEMYKYYWLKSH